MRETIHWSNLTPEQRNTLIAEKAMGITDFLCAGSLSYDGSDTMRQHNYYICQKCRARLTITKYYREGCGIPKEHTIPIPRYSESMDAAWLVIEKMKKAKWSNFCYELDDILTQHRRGWDRSTEKPYVTWFEHFMKSLNAEGICIAALQTCGITVELT